MNHEPLPAQGPVDVNVRGWMPIETAPANTWILTFAEWDSDRPIGISLFKDTERVVEKVESECHNRKGRRRVMQEETVTEREWDGDHWEPTHWMPLPDAPNDQAKGRAGSFIAGTSRLSDGLCHTGG